MHFSIVFPSLLLLGTPSLASTTYGCWSEKSAKFHKDCMVAVSGLVMLQTGPDDNAWIPPNVISHSWGVCTAKIRGSGKGNVVAAINLLASFEQLGARCQNGYFYYDQGFINAELNGHAGWKRDTIEFEGGVKTWNTTESIPHYESEQPEWFHEEKEEQPVERSTSNELAKRAPQGKFVTSLTNRAGTFALWRGTQVGSNLHPGSNVLVTEMYNVILDLVDGALTNTGTYILRSGLDTQSGSTVNVLALAIQLSGHYSSWQDMFNKFGDSGDLARSLIYSAVNNWSGEDLTAGVYHVYNRFNDVVFSLILNGVGGTVTGFPSK
ncbi:hypothetical protein ABW20_dc0109937 [Dactylellina cionopaga]|nr:hypothetical protein ABW20_dc0109937 [Dactylellina cionopaga]